MTRAVQVDNLSKGQVYWSKRSRSRKMDARPREGVSVKSLRNEGRNFCKTSIMPVLRMEFLDLEKKSHIDND